jgi:hypothetical protein
MGMLFPWAIQQHVGMGMHLLLLLLMFLSQFG